MQDQVRKTIEVIRPSIQADGGDIFVRSIDEAIGVVTVELTGACAGCPASILTLKVGVERILKDRVPGVTAVEQYPAAADPESFDHLPCHAEPGSASSGSSACPPGTRHAV